jgi:hypothetical protein
MSSSGPLVHLSDRRTPLDWLRLWFLLRDPVGRRDYIISGFAQLECDAGRDNCVGVFQQRGVVIVCN